MWLLDRALKIYLSCKSDERGSKFRKCSRLFCYHQMWARFSICYRVDSITKFVKKKWKKFKSSFQSMTSWIFTQIKNQSFNGIGRNCFGIWCETVLFFLFVSSENFPTLNYIIVIALRSPICIHHWNYITANNKIKRKWGSRMFEFEIRNWNGWDSVEHN